MIGPRWARRLLLVACFGAGVYAIVYVDVVLRAREAWQEGEKYWRWADFPAERLAYLQAEQRKEAQALDARRAAGKISEDDYARDKELLTFRYEQMAQESSVKYAYVWYQTAVELFSPPESKWVRLSREKMPLAKERWKAELRAKGIPFEDYMLE